MEHAKELGPGYKFEGGEAGSLMAWAEAITLPIAEIFTSPQGEGLYAGVLMTFVRLAGCSVGKPISPKEKSANPELAQLPAYVERCCTYDGRPFLCDTDFRLREKLSAEEIIQRVPEGVKHICITGGEPLMHDLHPLFKEAWQKKLQIHIETSGTILFDERAAFGLFWEIAGREGYREHATREWLWLTVSPKYACLPEMIAMADEIKLLVDEHFDLQRAEQLVESGPRSSRQLVYIQPISFEHSLDFDNVKRCLEIQKQKPSWRLSLQIHKILKCR